MKLRIYRFKQLLGIAFVCLSLSLVAQPDTTKILFVGNSFTYFFNLPQVVSSMALSQDTFLMIRQSTVGGSSLEEHWKGEKGTKTRALLETGDWDYVVFNNHSLSAINTPESFMTYSKKFVDLVREKGAEPIFMMTWAYESNPLMQSKITEMYQRLAAETKTNYVPAGPIFAEARKWRPDLPLFFDDKHPSSNGTYLLGLTFYKFFTGKSTADIPMRLTTKDMNGEKLYLLFMHQEDADFLQQLVDEYAIELKKIN
jgi:hypothetical protein